MRLDQALEDDEVFAWVLGGISHQNGWGKTVARVGWDGTEVEWMIRVLLDT